MIYVRLGWRVRPRLSRGHDRPAVGAYFAVDALSGGRVQWVSPTHMSTLTRIAFALASLTLALPLPADTDVHTYGLTDLLTGTASLSVSGNGSTSPTFTLDNPTLSIAQFDPLLGTLDSVTIGFTLGYSASAYFGTTEATAELRTVGGTLFLGGYGYNGTGGSNGAYGIAGNTSNFPVSISHNWTANRNGGGFNPALWPALQGSGTVLWEYAGNMKYSLNDFAPAANGSAHLTSANLTVTYGYTPQIPEPATYAVILGVGVLGMALWRSRR